MSGKYRVDFPKTGSGIIHKLFEAFPVQTADSRFQVYRSSGVVVEHIFLAGVCTAGRAQKKSDRKKLYYNLSISYLAPTPFV